MSCWQLSVAYPALPPPRSEIPWRADNIYNVGNCSNFVSHTYVSFSFCVTISNCTSLMYALTISNLMQKSSSWFEQCLDVSVYIVLTMHINRNISCIKNSHSYYESVVQTGSSYLNVLLATM